jgi:hypothetical protein
VKVAVADCSEPPELTILEANLNMAIARQLLDHE